ncbi:MAG: hypothetical protein HY606_12355, partial [Planctomycetes bacterium]|nr:hypothetical protein [Planctomycetota bacterium]
MDRLTYMLRRNLLLWKSEETIDEVVKYCIKYDIDEVIWKIDPEEFSCGFPGFDKINKYVEALKMAKEALEGNKIRFSINPWLTLGHADRGRDMRKVFSGMSFFVDWEGKTCKACACPMSGGWQKWIIEAYKLYASTYPYILWLEDDFRNFNHQPCDYGCFCDIHIKEFSKIIRQGTSRQEIVRAILKSGHPHPWRKKWFDMLGKVMVDVSGKIEKAVHEVSPDTQLGLMCSDPDDHAIEGRDWDKLYKNLSGRHQPVSRPSMGYYGMSDPMDFFGLSNGFKKTISILPKGSRKCAELENSRYTRFSKSVKFTKIQVAIGFFAGANDMTLNLFDMLGTPIEQEEGYLKMLKDVKPYYHEITEIVSNTLETGIGLLYHPRQSDNVILKDNAVYADLKPSGCG